MPDGPRRRWNESDKVELTNDRGIAEPVIAWIARQIGADAAVWTRYGEREETRREHLQKLRVYLGMSSFGLSEFRALVHGLTELAMQTDKGVVLAAQALETLRQRRIIPPAAPPAPPRCRPWRRCASAGSSCRPCRSSSGSTRRPSRGPTG